LDNDEEKRMVLATIYNMALFLLIGAGCWFTTSAWPCIMIVATADGVYSRKRWPQRCGLTRSTAAAEDWPDPDVSTDRGGDTHRGT